MKLRLSLRVRTALLLLVVALLPLTISFALGLPRYGLAAREAEERRQLALIARLASALTTELRATEAEALAVASAIHTASSLEGVTPEFANQFVAASLQQTQHLSLVRLEVPSARFETVIAKAGIDDELAPHSTEALRLLADSEGAAVSMTGAVGIIVVAIPRKNESSPRGYITTPVLLAVLAETLDQTAIELDWSGAAAGFGLLDQQGQPLLSHGFAMPLGYFAHAGQLASAQNNARVGAVFSFEEDGQTMLGAYEGIDFHGWSVASWRPEAEALSTYQQARTFALWLGGLVGLAALLLAVLSARALTKPLLLIAAQAKNLGARRWAASATPLRRSDELGDLSRELSFVARDLEQSEHQLARDVQLRADLSRFMGGELVERIVRGEHALALGGVRSEITVVFADLVAFSKAAEGLPPEQVVALLNELFTLLSEVVFRHGGTVDKFVGDAIMAVWGAPLADPDHAEHALDAAEDMLRFVEAGRGGFRRRYGVDVQLAIGINSGEALVGNIGSSKRMEYTAIGDAVNVASRLEGLAAPNQILLGQATASRLPARTDLRLLGERTLAGRENALKVYELSID